MRRCNDIPVVLSEAKDLAVVVQVNDGAGDLRRGRALNHDRKVLRFAHDGRNMRQR